MVIIQRPPIVKSKPLQRKRTFFSEYNILLFVFVSRASMPMLNPMKINNMGAKRL